MAKVLRVVAIVAAAVAVVATAGAGLGAILGGTMTFVNVSSTTIAAIAGAVSAAASVGAQLLTKPPPPRGSLNQIIIQTDAPQPRAMGRTYFGGVLRHTASYGATLNKIPNPYLGRVVVYSGSGPIESITPQVDFGAVGAYYSTFLYTTSQLGQCPESAALVPAFAGFPGWTTNHKLSGQAALLWNFLFDKDGKRFASGLPNTGAILEGASVYDPRLDSTYPGGSGAHRIDDPATWEYSENPALHAIAYAYGIYQNDRKVFGIGMAFDAIDMAAFVAWANVCDANVWKISGTIFEPDDRMKNLRDIMAAGGAEPAFSGAVLSVKYHAPRVALDTITEDDLSDDGGEITAMRTYRDRLNTLVPKWRSEDHNWEYVAGDPVVISSYLAEDGEEKKEERQFNLVADPDQAAQLAAYELLERRELGLIELSCGPRLRSFRPGECLIVDLPDQGLDELPAIILRRVIEPGSMGVRLTLIGETPTKHAFALGQTGTAPPTPALGMTQEERDAMTAVIDVIPSDDVILDGGTA